MEATTVTDRTADLTAAREKFDLIRVLAIEAGALLDRQGQLRAHRFAMAIASIVDDAVEEVVD